MRLKRGARAPPRRCRRRGCAFQSAGARRGRVSCQTEGDLVVGFSCLKDSIRKGTEGPTRHADDVEGVQVLGREVCKFFVRRRSQDDEGRRQKDVWRIFDVMIDE